MLGSDPARAREFLLDGKLMLCPRIFIKVPDLEAVGDVVCPPPLLFPEAVDALLAPVVLALPTAERARENSDFMFPGFSASRLLGFSASQLLGCLT